MDKILEWWPVGIVIIIMAILTFLDQSYLKSKRRFLKALLGNLLKIVFGVFIVLLVLLLSGITRAC